MDWEKVQDVPEVDRVDIYDRCLLKLYTIKLFIVNQKYVLNLIFFALIVLFLQVSSTSVPLLELRNLKWYIFTTGT